MATSEDLELVSLTKNISSEEDKEGNFQRIKLGRPFSGVLNLENVVQKHLNGNTVTFVANGQNRGTCEVYKCIDEDDFEELRVKNILVPVFHSIETDIADGFNAHCEMESGRGHGGVIRGGPGGKKMRKRKELDALVGGVGVKRSNGGNKRPGSGGVSPQDQLLSESTGEEEYWSSAKGGACGKGRRHYNSHNGKRRARACTALLRLCTILLVMACVVATITVMWLFIDIKEQTTYLRSQLDQVSAGNEAIPDAIQQCHSLTRQLEKNQTKIIDQMQQIAQRLTNFSNMISSLQVGLANVEKKLSDSPELVTTPTTLRTLASSVATIGGQLNDFNITTAKVSNEQKKILEQIDGIMRNLTYMNEDIQDLRENPFIKTSMPNQNSSAMITQEVIEKISPNITAVNKTLSNRIKWVLVDLNTSQKSINELKDDYEYCKSQIMTIKDDQVNQNKIIKELKVDASQMKKDVSDCKAVVENSETYIRNISMQIASCSQACQNNSTTTLPMFSASTLSSSRIGE